jgi:uncharacterized membrane protein YkvA (DUF1232 family)
MSWEWIVAGLICALDVAVAAVWIWWRRSFSTRDEALAYAKSLGLDLVRLPGRLRRVANDPRTPRRARWWLVGLAIYVASPVDLIPDFIPGLGHIDELVLVPLVLRHIRNMIPVEVWSEHFPQRTGEFSEPST